MRGRPVVVGASRHVRVGRVRRGSFSSLLDFHFLFDFLTHPLPLSFQP